MKKVGMFVDNGLWEEWVELEVDDDSVEKNEEVLETEN